MYPNNHTNVTCITTTVLRHTTAVYTGDEDDLTQHLSEESLDMAKVKKFIKAGINLRYEVRVN